MKLYNRITLFMVILAVAALVSLPASIAQPPGSGRGGQRAGGDRTGRSGDRGDGRGAADRPNRGGGRGDVGPGGRSGGRGGPQRMSREELTDAQIDRILKAYSERDPEGAKRLQEQRTTMTRERFQQALTMAAWAETFAERDQYREYNRILELCEKCMPDEAKGIRELRDTNYDLYKQRLDSLRDKYRMIWPRITSPRTPQELVPVIVRDFQLGNKERELSWQYANTTDPEDKESILANIRDVVSARYDLGVQQREIQYKQIQKEMDALKTRLDAEMKAVEKMKDPQARETGISFRVDSVISPRPWGQRGFPQFFSPPEYPAPDRASSNDPNSEPDAQ
ncbi:MAG: hypothetical protein P8016_04990 [Sedimentisphaerales bacterium]